jgi:hypothetical protein
VPDLDPVVLAAVAAVAVLLLVGLVLSATRRRRDAALEPTRLGPSWAPPAADPDAPIAVDPPEVDRDRVRAVAERSGWDEPVVATVLGAWIEYLGVVGLRKLPPDHDYRVYDPYDPPVVKRAADRTPIADPERVARDVAARTRVPEPAAIEILTVDQQLGDTAGVPDTSDRSAEGADAGAAVPDAGDDQPER